MQYDQHVFDWLAWRLYGQQQDNHVWAWRLWLSQMHGLYAHLVRHQEPLGIEFERVLYNNLFELYAR